jgi:hypothetical protein
MALYHRRLTLARKFTSRAAPNRPNRQLLPAFQRIGRVERRRDHLTNGFLRISLSSILANSPRVPPKLPPPPPFSLYGEFSPVRYGLTQG